MWNTTVTTVTSQNTTHFWYFFHYIINLLLPLYYYKQTSLKLCKHESDLLFRILYPVFVIVSMTQYVKNFNLQIPHDRICRHSLDVLSSSLKLYFRTGRSSPYNQLFVGLVSSKPKQISTKGS